MPSISKITNALAAVAALLATATAHTAVKEWVIDGVQYPGFYQGSKQDPGNNSPAWWTGQGWGWQPVMGDKINHPDIICHMDASPSPYTVKATAGQKITAEWAHEGECKQGETGWDCSHHGSASAYLARYDGDNANVDKTQLNFFKIAGAGLLGYPEGRWSQGSPQEQSGFWATDDIFYKNGNKQYIEIPKSIPNGKYFLRVEVMSIHNNGPVSERQFWPQCVSIEVTGGTDGAQVPDGKKATELYSTNDPILKHDMYWHDAGAAPAAAGPDVPQAIAAALAGKKARRHAKDITI